MPALGPWELIVILLIVVVIFGAGRLSEVGGAVGKSIREFRKATGDETHPAQTTPVVAPPPAPVAAAPVAQPLAGATTTTAVPVVAPVAGAVVAAPVVVTENKCPSCATVNPPEQVFCGQCGTRLTRAA
jgi:sec-independent protein translocase protein TatA